MISERIPMALIGAENDNQVTLQSYATGIQEYVDGTPGEVTGNVKAWIDHTLALLPAQARIIEIGSAFGRDARYMEDQGFVVNRTDATEGFVKLLWKEGYSAQVFNILADPFDAAYDLIFANAVFLHFNPQELQSVLHKVHGALTDKGLLSFSVKHGEGKEWTTAKVGNPRYFCYWHADAMKTLLETTGFHVIEITEDQKFIQIIAQKS